MNIKNLLIGAFCIGGGWALSHLVFSHVSLHKKASGSTDYDTIDAYLEAQMRRLHIPGISLAVIEGDRILHQRGFGIARPGGETPTPHTPFLIGSLTKSFTALAVMQLVEDGKADLDAPVQLYLPWFRVADPLASAQITLRHLLNQTSGLPTVAGEAVLGVYGDGPDATERKVRDLSSLKINPVGEKVAYCNLNYDILGLVIETVSGESYPDYIQNHIFNPLKMDLSFTSRVEAEPHNLAMGYRHWFSVPFPAKGLPFSRASLPSGYLISCAEDMAHYLIAHLNGGRYEDAQVLSPAGMDELHRGAMEYITFGVSSGSYAMGWFDQTMGGTRVISHSGNVPDFSAFMAFIPEKKKGLVMLLNADPYGLPPITEELGLNTTAVLAGQQPAAVKLEFIQWVMRLLPLIPLAQLAGAIATLRLLHRWHLNPGLRPKRGRLWALHILLPLVPNLSLSALLAYLQSTGLQGHLELFNPDLAWITRLSGGFAAVWAMLRTRLILRTMR